MIFANTFKITTSRFSIVWKLMLYIFGVYAIMGAITTGFCVPIVRTLQNGGLFNQIETTMNEFFTNLNVKELLTGLSGCVSTANNIIVANISKLTLFFVLIVLTIVLLCIYVKGFYRMPVERSIVCFMSSNANIRFSDAVSIEFGKNCLYNLVYMFTILPINVLIILIGIWMCSLFSLGGAFIVLTPIFIIVVITVLNSAKLTLFAGWMPYMLYEDSGVFKALGGGFRVIRRRFSRVFSSAVCLTLVLIAINLVFGVFLFGAGLIITIPLSHLLVSVFNEVSFYSSYGLRYYIDPNNVVAPRRRKYTENFDRQKYII